MSSKQKPTHRDCAVAITNYVLGVVSQLGYFEGRGKSKRIKFHGGFISGLDKPGEAKMTMPLDSIVETLAANLDDWYGDKSKRLTKE